MAITTPGGAAPVSVGSVRRRLAAGLVVSAIAAIGVLIFLAVVADGREVSQASSNDGGAWLVNRQLGVVGHRNRSAGELSAVLRFSESPSAEVHQAEGVVVVHDPDARLLYEIDTRTFNEDAEPTTLPAEAEVLVTEDTVFIVEADAGRIWQVDMERLSSLPNLTSLQPVLEASTPVHAVASGDGRLAVVDGESTLRWIMSDGKVTAPIELEVSEVVDVSIVEGSAVVLDDSGRVVVASQAAVEHVVVWPAVGSRLTVLQQPSATKSSDCRCLGKRCGDSAGARAFTPNPGQGKSGRNRTARSNRARRLCLCGRG